MRAKILDQFLSMSRKLTRLKKVGKLKEPLTFNCRDVNLGQCLRTWDGKKPIFLTAAYDLNITKKMQSDYPPKMKRTPRKTRFFVLPEYWQRIILERGFMSFERLVYIVRCRSRRTPLG